MAVDESVILAELRTLITPASVDGEHAGRFYRCCSSCSSLAASLMPAVDCAELSMKKLMKTLRNKFGEVCVQRRGRLGARGRSAVPSLAASPCVGAATVVSA